MPSAEHEVLVAMLRDQPELARSLLLASGIELPLEAPLRPLLRSDSENQGQPKSVEFRADTVLILGEPRPIRGIVVEVQLAEDPGKRRSWPNYLTGLYAKLECPCLLVVVTPSRSVARWAARPIEVSPDWVLRPVVIGPEQIPIVTDPALARRIPELAVLSAIAHGEDDPETAARIALTVRDAISHLDEDTRALYSDLMESHLGPAARKAFQAMIIPENYQFRGFTFLAAKEEGLLEGRQEGLLKGERQLLLRLLRAKFGELSKATETRVHEATEPDLLDWSERVLTAASIDQVFGG